MLSHLVPNFSKLVVATVVDNMIPKSRHLAIWVQKMFQIKIVWLEGGHQMVAMI